MVPNIPNQETVSPLPISRENEGPIRKKVIWLRKVIKPIVRDRYKIPLLVNQAL